MPKSVTRWDITAQWIIGPVLREALIPYVVDELTVPEGEITFGPTDDIPEGQYECYRTWNTRELAQNWIDIVDELAAPTGFKSTHRAIIE